MTDSNWQLASDSRWTPALRRAVMRVRPEYFGWTRAERERYGVAVPKADADEIDRHLQKELFGCTRARDDLDGEQLDRFNATILPLWGVGEDCFYLNEWLGDGTFLDFETLLRDYDHDDFVFQEKCRREEQAVSRHALFLLGASFPRRALHLRKPYDGRRLSSWSARAAGERNPRRSRSALQRTSSSQRFQN